jgi:hypothetical protein
VRADHAAWLALKRREEAGTSARFTNKKRVVKERREQTYAERRYREGVKAWRRAIRRPLLLIIGPIFVGSIIWGITEHNRGAYFAGLVTGVSGAFAVIVWDDLPSYVENWGLGFRGENRTSAVLRTLGWPVVGDIDTGHGNYDHVVIGAAGVFLIESKNPRGTVEIEGGIPRLRRRHDPSARNSLRGDGAQAVRLACELRDAINARLGSSPRVAAIVVYWNPFPAKRFTEPNVTYLHGSELKTYLAALPAILPPETQAAVFSTVKALESRDAAEAA